MNKPRPGSQYIVTKDGFVEDIAAQAYGDPTKANLLWGANELKSNEVKAGDVLVIPGEPPANRLTGKDLDDMTLIADGVEIPIMSATIIRAMDTCADGFTVNIAWTPGLDSEIDRVTKPYAYSRAAIYIGDELLVAGRIYGVAPKMTGNGITKELKGFSLTVDAVDSVIPPGYQKVGVDLKQVADQFARVIGVGVECDIDTGGPFDTVTSTETETMFAHLAKLAAQRGLLISNTPTGDFLIHRAIKDGTVVGSLTENDRLVTEWSANYDGRRRFHTYRCITQGVDGANLDWSADTVEGGPVTVKAIDSQVPLSRFTTFRADETTPGNRLDAARWKKNKQIADALTQSLPVTDWCAPNGKLWEPNTLVSVKSDVFGVPNGFDFLIRSVEFMLGENRTAVLSLVPPQAFGLDRDIGDVWALEQD